PPLRPTPFPYTTLFRSWGSRGVRDASWRKGRREGARGGARRCRVIGWRPIEGWGDTRLALGPRRRQGEVLARAGGGAGQGMGGTDRKSTRLNSSHVKIS